jgi:GntR family transcriptional regulator/MocR family aminotransferase
MDILTPSFSAESKVPIYQQLYNYIKIEIQEGRLQQNSKLPSKRKLAAYLSISQNTVQAAYDQLIEEGYITAYEKKGYFVNQINGLQRLGITQLSAPVTSEEEIAPALYDFSYHGVDMPSFPFNLWRKLMKEIINEYDRELLQPGNSVGYGRLRAVLAAYLHHSRGVNCTQDQIIISSGTEMLFQILFQLFDHSYSYGIENPGYEKLSQLFKANRARFQAIPIDEGGMIPEEIERRFVNILCVTPAHQFPSGQIMPINRRIRLLNWAKEAADRYILEDDYDSEFKYSGKPIPALQGLDTNDKVIYMGSLSKSISPTLRVSYMVLPPGLMKRYQKELSYLLCPVPILEQKCLCRFIEEGYFERHLNRMRTIYKKKREVLVNEIHKLNCGIRICGADAGLHILLQVPNAMTEQQLIEAALSRGVRVYASSKYYSDPSYIPDIPTLLLGFAVMSEEEIRKSVQLLKAAWFPEKTVTVHSPICNEYGDVTNTSESKPLPLNYIT